MQKSLFSVLVLLSVLFLAAGGVAAHGGDGDAGHTDAPGNETAAGWGAWMEQHMTEHMGVDAAAWMQERMGMTFAEMGEHMAAGEGGSMMGGMGCHE